MPRLTLHLDRPLDLGRTVWPHLRGLHDPAMRVTGEHLIRATRTADGPATIEIRRRGDVRRGRGLGAGRGPGDRRGAGVHRARRRPIRIRARQPPPRRPRPPPAGPPDRAQRGGPRGADPGDPRAEGHGLRGPPRRTAGSSPGGASRRPGRSGCGSCRQPEVLAATPYHAFHPLGLERRRADLVRAVAARANRFEEIVTMPLPAAYARLRAMPGIGPWTAAEVAVRALGDPDAVSVGDFHLPSLVAYALAGEREGDRRADARAARAVPRPSRPRGPAPRGERDPARDARPADAAPLDRRDLAEYTKPGLAT